MSGLAIGDISCCGDIMGNEVKCRDGYWDFIRGLAILAVVSIHFIGFRTNDLGLYLIRQLVSVAVFMFVFLAGHFVNVDRVEDWPGSFIRRRIWRLGCPYLFWSVLITAIFSPSYFLSPAWFIWRSLLLGYGVTIGYYVIALVQLVLLTPFLVRCMRRNVMATLAVTGMLTLASAFSSTLAANGVMSSLGLSVPVPFPGIFFTMWGFPYVLGIAFRMHGETWVPRLSKRCRLIWAVTAAAFGAVLIEDTLGEVLGICTQAQFNLAGLLFASNCCLLVVSRKRGIRFGLVEILGRGSFLIYLTHIKMFAALRHVLPAWFGFGSDVLNVFQYFASLLIVAGVYCGLIFVGEKVLADKVRRLMAIS